MHASTSDQFAKKIPLVTCCDCRRQFGKKSRRFSRRTKRQNEKTQRKSFLASANFCVYCKFCKKQGRRNLEDRFERSNFDIPESQRWLGPAQASFGADFGGSRHFSVLGKSGFEKNKDEKGPTPERNYVHSVVHDTKDQKTKWQKGVIE